MEEGGRDPRGDCERTDDGGAEKPRRTRQTETETRGGAVDKPLAVLVVVGGNGSG